MPGIELLGSSVPCVSSLVTETSPQLPAHLTALSHCYRKWARKYSGLGSHTHLVQPGSGSSDRERRMIRSQAWHTGKRSKWTVRQANQWNWHFSLLMGPICLGLMAKFKIPRRLWVSLCLDHPFLIQWMCLREHISEGVYLHIWRAYMCVCVYVYTCSCICVFAHNCAAVLQHLFVSQFTAQCPTPRGAWWSIDRLVPSWVTKLLLHPHLSALEGWRNTTLGNLGCVGKIGNKLQSESHQLRKQLSQWEKKISITGYLVDKEKAAHCLVASFTSHLVVMTLTRG